MFHHIIQTNNEDDPKMTSTERRCQRKCLVEPNLPCFLDKYQPLEPRRLKYHSLRHFCPCLLRNFAWTRDFEISYIWIILDHLNHHSWEKSNTPDLSGHEKQLPSSFAFSIPTGFRTQSHCSVGLPDLAEAFNRRGSSGSRQTLITFFLVHKKQFGIMSQKHLS